MYSIIIFFVILFCVFFFIIYIYDYKIRINVFVYQIDVEVCVEKFDSKFEYIIVDIVNKEKVMCVVIGSRGMGFIRRIILGSISDFIFYYIFCLVVVVKMDE